MKQEVTGSVAGSGSDCSQAWKRDKALRGWEVSGASHRMWGRSALVAGGPVVCTVDSRERRVGPTSTSERSFQNARPRVAGLRAAEAETEEGSSPTGQPRSFEDRLEPQRCRPAVKGGGGWLRHLCAISATHAPSAFAAQEVPLRGEF